MLEHFVYVRSASGQSCSSHLIIATLLSRDVRGPEGDLCTQTEAGATVADDVVKALQPLKVSLLSHSRFVYSHSRVFRHSSRLTAYFTAALGAYKHHVLSFLF